MRILDTGCSMAFTQHAWQLIEGVISYEKSLRDKTREKRQRKHVALTTGILKQYLKLMSASLFLYLHRPKQ